MNAHRVGTWVALLAAASCGGTPTGVEDARVHVVEIDPAEAALVVGDTIRLTAVPRSEGGVTLSGLAVSWTSLSSTRATVTPVGTQGRVLATSAGTATISASVGGKSGQSRIDISNPLPVLASVSPEAVEAGSGAFTLVLSGSGFVSGSNILWNGSERPATYVSWTELRASIAESDIVSAGAVEVTVVAPAPGGGVSGSRTLTIEPATSPSTGPVVSVEISVDSVAVAEGEEVHLTATPKDAQGRVVAGRYVAWSASDAEIALVDGIGKLTGIRVGSTTITARVDGVLSSIPARVTADFPYDLVYSGWDGVDGNSARTYVTDLADPTRSAVRWGPDAPSGGAVPSPDGLRVAYVLVLPTGVRALTVANRDGSGALEIHLSTDPGCGGFTWSPDSGRLAFTCRIGDDDPDIWVVDADGTDLVNVTGAHPGAQEGASWSPSLTGGSSRIAYAQFVAGEPQIWTMSPDGSDPRQVTAGMDRQPSWSPDGATIAFQRTGPATFGDIWLVDAAGGNERGLVGAYLAGPQEAPVWSPDGRFLAFVSTHETYGSGGALSRQIYTVWADGSKLARRTAGGLEVGVPAWRVR